LSVEIFRLKELIGLLCDLLLVSGCGSVLSYIRVMDKENLHELVDMMIQNKIRSTNLYELGCLLDMAGEEGVKTYTSLNG
jgi:hypothetical protein